MAVMWHVTHLFSAVLLTAGFLYFPTLAYIRAAGTKVTHILCRSRSSISSVLLPTVS